MAINFPCSELQFNPHERVKSSIMLYSSFLHCVVTAFSFPYLSLYLLSMFSLKKVFMRSPKTLEFHYTRFIHSMSSEECEMMEIKFHYTRSNNSYVHVVRPGNQEAKVMILQVDLSPYHVHVQLILKAGHPLSCSYVYMYVYVVWGCFIPFYSLILSLVCYTHVFPCTFTCTCAKCMHCVRYCVTTCTIGSGRGIYFVHLSIVYDNLFHYRNAH